MTIKKLITRLYKGANFFGYSEYELNEKIREYDYNQSIFFESKVYTYSCHARLLEDKKVELVEYFNNGEKMQKTIFENKDEFYKKK